jgi:uncharacterized membrane protein YoaT (DUF817 family)
LSPQKAHGDSKPPRSQNAGAFPWRPRALLAFTIEEALSCLFPAAIFGALALSKKLPLFGLPRYDFLLLWCVFVQLLMMLTRLETKDEVKVIGLFHVIGLGLELFKTKLGSWSYPEFAYTKAFGLVPLYSGFMYSSVASYICQAWRRLKLTIENLPKLRYTLPVATLIYFNFFTHQLGLPDLRWWLALAALILFRRAIVHYEVSGQRYKMPVFLSFVLIGFFIYLAENIATFFGAWQYPNQNSGWQLVHASKISSWFLLVIISFIIVASLKNLKDR